MLLTTLKSVLGISIFQVLWSLINSARIILFQVIGLLKYLLKILELRVLVIISLSLQIVLILFGNRRKYIANKELQFVIWMAYLAADWAATTALGSLSHSSTTTDPSSDPNLIIMASWASFLLLHLGGPDSITAYALEDNELWHRRAFGLLSKLGGAIYVIIWISMKSGTYYQLAVSLPVLVAGIIKCGERATALMFGSRDNFRKSLLPPPDAGPNYAKFMDDYNARKAEGYRVEVGKVIDETTPTQFLSHSQGTIENDSIQDALPLHDGFHFFRIFDCLFADLILSFQDHKSSQIFFQEITWNYAFQVVEVELGLMYDLLYTKSALIYRHTRKVISLKIVSFSCTLAAFICFCCLIVTDNRYASADKSISLILFTGAILLEIYAAIVLLSSDWAMFWLTEHNNRGLDLLYNFISWCQRWCKLSHSKRWSNLMSQFNLLSFCLKDKPVKWIGFQKTIRIYKLLEKYHYQLAPESVPPKLKSLIFDQLLGKSPKATDIEACKQLCALRGNQVLEKWKCDDINISESIRVEFDQSILLWHIATDLCYYSDETHNPDGFKNHSCKTSKLLSNYMLYLLVKQPSMLPNGIGQISFEDTCAEAIELFQERKYISTRNQACKMLLRVNTEIPPSDVKGDRNKSLLFDACRLAKSLQALEADKKWKMMSEVWVEMLSYAACKCRGSQHSKQLGQGGELLTHVWLLMAHLGITEQLQISSGHARAKLKVS